MSYIRWAIAISAISGGSLGGADGDVVEAFGEPSPERILRILARLRCQTRMASNSIAAVNRTRSVSRVQTS